MLDVELDKYAMIGNKNGNTNGNNESDPYKTTKAVSGSSALNAGSGLAIDGGSLIAGAVLGQHVIKQPSIFKDDLKASSGIVGKAGAVGRGLMRIPDNAINGVNNLKKLSPTNVKDYVTSPEGKELMGHFAEQQKILLPATLGVAGLGAYHAYKKDKATLAKQAEFHEECEAERKGLKKIKDYSQEPGSPEWIKARMKKVAADDSPSAKDILKSVKVKNTTPGPDTKGMSAWQKIKANNRQPENFRKGSNVKTKLRPDYEHGKTDVGLNIRSSGYGRHNQFLHSENDYTYSPNDDHKADVSHGIESAVKTKKRWNAGATATELGTMALGAKAGSKNGGVPGLLGGAAMGGVAAALPAFALHSIGKHKGDVKVLNSIDSKNRQNIQDLKHDTAKALSQHANKGRMTAENYYVY